MPSLVKKENHIIVSDYKGKPTALDLGTVVDSVLEIDTGGKLIYSLLCNKASKNR